MNPDWQDFLQRNHAQLTEGVVLGFGNPEAELAAVEGGTILCDLSQYGVLRVSGEDAQNYLQNMLSSDVKAVTPVQAQISSFNTPKGRMLAIFMVWKAGGDYFLQLPRRLLAPIQKKFSMYVLRSKVRIEDASSGLACLGLAGDNAEALIKEHVTDALPQENFETQTLSPQDDGEAGSLSVIRLDSKRFQLIASPQKAMELWKKLQGGATPAGAACWNLTDIRAGTPVVLPETQEAFVPQMTNLELIGGVSFKKGCYPGQEVVARLQHIGKTKQRMYLAHVEAAAEPKPGEKIYCEHTGGNPPEDHASGTIVTAAAAPGGGYDLLAVTQIASLEHPMHLGSLQGAKLSFLPLPYPIPA